VKVTHPTLRYSLVTAGLATVVGCSEPATAPHRVSSIAITGPTEITGPGVVRASVAIKSVDSTVLNDTISTTVTTTGPFTSTWESSPQTGRRVLLIVASAPGSGSVTVSADGQKASITITAVALSFRSIAAADGYACGIAIDQRAWCWGGNDTGELGVATVGDCNGADCQYGGNSGNPTPLPVAGNRAFTQIATSAVTSLDAVSCATSFVLEVCGRTCALTAVGEAFCWGMGYSSQTQIGAGINLSALSVVVPSILFDADAQSCGLTSTGAGYCFTTSATQIGGGMTFTSLSMGHDHSCGVGADGNVYCWGSNLRGGLGIGSVDSLAHPNPVQAIASVKFTSVAVGSYSTCALDTSGTVQCWGQGFYPACSSTTTPCQATPQPVAGGGTYTAFSLAQDGWSLCGLTSGGAVSCWSFFSSAPSVVSLPEPMANISVGYIFGLRGCGVAVSHAAYCWDANYVVSKFGQ